jgi:hypothetical protein
MATNPMPRKPLWATRTEWRRLGYRPVRGATYVIERGRRVYGAWWVEVIP